MSKETTSLLIAGVLFLAPAAGCKTAPRQESGLADEMATNMTYGGPPRAASAARPVADEWVCPMHPKFKQSQPGKCSICGMDLVRSDGRSGASDSGSGSGHSHSSHSGHSGSGHTGSSGCGSCGG